MKQQISRIFVYLHHTRFHIPHGVVLNRMEPCVTSLGTAVHYPAEFCMEMHGDMFAVT